LTISSSALFRVVFTSSTKTSCALLLLCFCRPPNSLPATLQKTANTASVSFADENQQNRATEASDSALSAFSSQSPRDPVRGAMSLPSSTSLSPSSPLHSFSLRAVIGTLQRLFLLRGKLRGLTLVVLETGMDGRMSWTLSVLFFFFLLLFLILMIIQDRADILNVPTIHLPHLLRIIGPSSLTLFKHVLGRQRILIYTLPPVEVACILCQAAADMCYQVQTAPDPSRIKARNRDPICVLGMVTLSDLDRLHLESQSTRGWIACTTDALFLEKPSYYDLLIDLTTSTPHKATRPTFYASKPVSHTKTSTHRLSTIRFAWSDVKLVSSCSLFFHSDLILDTSGTRSSVYYNSTRTHRTVVLPPLPHQTLFPRLLNRNLYLHGRTLGACMKMCVLYVLGCGWARGAVILCSRIRV